MAWLTPGKYAPPPPRMCYRAQFGRFALNGVGINTGEPSKWGALELRSLGMEGMADTRISTCCHVKFVK